MSKPLLTEFGIHYRLRSCDCGRKVGSGNITLKVAHHGVTIFHFFALPSSSCSVLPIEANKHCKNNFLKADRLYLDLPVYAELLEIHVFPKCISRMHFCISQLIA